MLLTRAIRCKEAVLREQASLLAVTQHSAATSEPLAELIPSRYSWVCQYLDNLDRAIATGFDAFGGSVDVDSLPVRACIPFALTLQRDTLEESQQACFECAAMLTGQHMSV